MVRPATVIRIATVLLVVIASVRCSGEVLVNPEPPAAIASVSGNGQTAPVGTALGQPLVVVVTGASGAPVAGVAVAWAVTAGGGSLSTTSTTTGANGRASVTWMLGAAVGANANVATATVAGLTGSPVTFLATGTSDGTIEGTITLSGGPLLFVSPRPAAALSTAAPTGAGMLATKPGRGRLSDGTPARRASRRATAVGNELIVTYRAASLARAATGTTMRDASRALSSRLAKWERGGDLRVAGASPTTHTVRLVVSDPSRLDAIAAELSADPSVARVERNAIVRGLRVASPVTPRIARRLVAPALSNDSAFVFQAWNYRMIDAPGGWDLTTGSTSVIVAVIDDGIRFDHPELAANLTADGYDFVSDAAVNDCAGGTVSSAGDGNGYDADATLPIVYEVDDALGCVSGPADDGGHGLHVAGTVGAVGNNTTGITGINWTVRIRPIRAIGTTGTGTAYDVAQAILYAAGLPADDGAGGTVIAPSRAPIINLSFGTATNSGVVQAAVVQATAAGSLIVAAAGNEASTAPVYPAALDEVLAVSAVGPDGLLASYSNFGPTIDIAAPGGDHLDGGCEFGVMSTWWLFGLGGPGYDCVEGTSMAASHVSGVAALLLARESALSAAQLRARLTAWAIDMGATGRDDAYGAGIVNARNALTQTSGPIRQLYVQLHDATTGALITRIAAQPGSPYVFTGLADGTYRVYAGMDADGDERVGIPGRLWGAFGGAASPATIAISGGGTQSASFTLGAPTETEPNETTVEAGTLLVGGYVRGFTSSTTDADVHRLVIATPGTFTVETSAVAGACGFALEEDTSLELLDAAGAVLAQHDDVDFFGRNYCSRISMALAAGTYYVRVRGLNGGRRYNLEARAGS